MSDVLRDRRVAILAADGVERVELEQPRQAVQDAGAQVELLSISEGEIAARNNGRGVRRGPACRAAGGDGIVNDASAGSRSGRSRGGADAPPQDSVDTPFRAASDEEGTGT